MMYSIDEVKIRPFIPEDIKGDWKDWKYDPEVTRYNSHGLFPQTSEEVVSFIRNLSSKNSIVWAILSCGVSGKHEYRHIGNVDLKNINWINSSAEIAIVIGNKKFWGQGVAKKAFQMAFYHGFCKLGLNRIWTGTAACNIGMNKVAKSVGMVFEGYFKDGMLIHGCFENINCYRLLRKEWDRLDIKWSPYE